MRGRVDARQALMKSRLRIMDKALARLCACFGPAAPAGIETVKVPQIFVPQNAPRWCGALGGPFK
jgi:hypothetical protein